MVNVNVQLPPIVTAVAPQAAETIHRENQLLPTIPKTEETHSYSKMRDKEEREQVAHQSHEIIQEQDYDDNQQGKTEYFSQRREHFFAEKLQSLDQKSEDITVELSEIADYKQIKSVIEAKYNNAVSPLPDLTINVNV